jgi:hypothetical protein
MHEDKSPTLTQILMDPLIIVFRIIGPLLILRRPLLGGLFAAFLDGIDWYIHVLPYSLPHRFYPFIDKSLDLYYLALEAWVVLSWKNTLMKRLLVGAFLYRCAGMAAFILTGDTASFFWFANIFEPWFLFCCLLALVRGRGPDTRTPLLWIGFSLLAAAKYFQEYVMHVPEQLHWRYTVVHITSAISITYDHIAVQAMLLAALTAGSMILDKRNRRVLR